MFCPSCGIEEVHSNQYCRGCGSDLRRVRNAIAAPDSITASAASARDEIGRAIAAKIRDTRSPAELSVVAEDVLPQIEKFLESPEEKRLRRMRTGMIISSVGLGAALGITGAWALMNDKDIIFLAGLGIVTLFIGLGFILNGYFLTVPISEAVDNAAAGDRQRELDATEYTKPELPQPSAQSFASSVTEHTTKHLEEEMISSRERSS
ncbi:MAG: hypothetical protein HOP17_00070 [Acidobacteria bacterium]|nr:hypothetical protein [Acidobacteriota bacterium]